MTRIRDMANFASDVPTAIGSAGQVLKVNAGATAYAWEAIGDTLPSGATAGKVLQRNAGNSAYEWGDGLPTGATAGQVLQRNAGNSAYVWGTIETGTALPVIPSNWLSPTNTYSTSGTWTKGSLADDDFLWAYLVGGGGKSEVSYNGSFTTQGGKGGGAVLVYGAASTLHNAVYTIGAGSTSALGASESKIVLADGRQFSTVGNSATFNVVSSVTPSTNLIAQPQVPSLVAIKDALTFSEVFAARNGQNTNYDANTTASGLVSTYAGNGGAGIGGGQGGTPSGSPFHGVVPGGGGGSVNGYYSNASQASRGNGAAGNLRVYHV